MASGFSCRISVPGNIKVGQTVTATIKPVCYNVRNNLANVNYGIGYGNRTETAWKKNSSMMYCDQGFEFKFVVTQDMFNQQQSGHSIFVYATDTTSRRFIRGAGNGRTAGLKIYLPGAEPIMGRVYVATIIRAKPARSRGERICHIYADRYRNGILERRNDDYGNCYCSPHGKVFNEYAASWWGAIRYIRESLYNSRAKDEQEWLIKRGVKVVPEAWSPMLGEPGPICTIAGSLSAPNQISAVMKNWVPELTTTSLLVTLPLTISCTDVGKAVSPPGIAGALPVTFSINDIDIATLYPASAITFDLVSYLAAWKHLLSIATTELTLKARVESSKIGTARIKAFSTETMIPVSVAECEEGTKRNLTTCWDGSVIHGEVFRGGVWIPTGESCPVLPATGEKRNPTTCWDNSVIHGEVFNGSAWIPSGEVCPVLPAAGARRTPKTCWDGSIIHAEKFDAVTKTWIPTGEVCSAEPPAGAKRESTTCWDGTVIYGEVFRDGRWVKTGATCPAMPAAGSRRNPTPCWDRSVIHTEIFSGGAWIPSGEKCPEKRMRQSLEIAVPKIAYEGQPVDIVARVFCGAAASHDENASLVIDGVTIDTKKTKAGEVKFRWTARGVGMRKVCINVPATESCKIPATECETMMVSAHVAGIAEQIKKEKAAYEERLTELKKRKKIAAGKVRRPGVPGYVRIPASLAGTVINVGGVKVTVPPGGTTVPVPSGDSIVSVIQEGISTNVPILVSPGEVINLPTAGLPGLPGGL